MTRLIPFCAVTLLAIAGCSSPTPPETAADKNYAPPPPSTMNSTSSTTPTDTPSATTPGSAYTNGNGTGSDLSNGAKPGTYDGAPTGNTGTNTNGNTTGTDGHGNASGSSMTAPAPGGSNPDADNTKNNTKDRNGGTVTPLDQGNGTSDLKMTKDIRRDVMKDSSLSALAKNVKVITNGGKVTLRGVVKTEAERTTIEGIARKIAGDAQVDDQIEIKK